MVGLRRVFRARLALARSSLAVATLAAIVIVLAPPARGGQSPTSADASLHITGRVGHPLTLYLADLEQLPQKITAVNDEKGAAVTYEGVAVAELLRQAGAPLGPQLRGPQMRLYVVVKASDGYQPVFALPEFDPAFTDRVIILAYRRDGHAMALPEGPLRLIVPGEKRHARWVREVTALEVEAAQ